MTDHHTAIGSMVRDAFKRGHREGFLEGMAAGFLLAIVVIIVRSM